MSGIWRIRRTLVVCGLLLSLLAPVGVAGETEHRVDRHAFVAHLDALVPALLEKTKTPGAAVGLIEDGDVFLLRGYGLADKEARRPVTPKTLFNVGSVSKVVTAWGVVDLHERGRIDLDEPVNRYLKRWQVPGAEVDTDGVTVRRLLSHMAGVSLSAVPEYKPGKNPPPLVAALNSETDGVRLIHQPGTQWSYSGGGYMVLQLLIEDVTGQEFSAFMSEHVMMPLGMSHATFRPDVAQKGDLAAPYDESGARTSIHQYAGLAAAGLYATVEDLARLAVAGMCPFTKNEYRVLEKESVREMQQPAPGTEALFFKSGLGYRIIPLPGNATYVGHSGSNTGWMATLSTIPAQGDGVVVLTNSSNGESVYRWILCDWVHWKTGAFWPRYCDDRSNQPGGTLHEE